MSSVQLVFAPTDSTQAEFVSVCLSENCDPMIYPVSRINYSESDEELRELKEAKLSVEKTDELNRMAFAKQPYNIQSSQQPVLSDVGLKPTKCGGTMHCQTISCCNKVYAPMTSRWLNEHFHEEKGSTISRGAMYDFYLTNFDKIGLEPCNAAMFGKVVRSVFPDLTTRRLGTRGHSKYHYYGLGKKTSYCMQLSNLRLPEMRTINTSNDCEHNHNSQLDFLEPVDIKPNFILQHNNSDELDNVLSSFPKYKTFGISGNFYKAMDSFSNLYKIHAMNIIVRISKWDLHSGRNIVNAFWAMALSEKCYIDILSDSRALVFVEECNKHINKAISDILIPGILQPLPETRKRAIKQFAVSYPCWIDQCISLKQHPKVSQVMFASAMKLKCLIMRQTHISEMATGAREILHDCETVQALLEDWKRLDISNITSQCRNVCAEEEVTTFDIRMRKYIMQFQQLLIKQTTFHQYIEWLKSIAANCLQQDAMLVDTSKEDLTRNLILRLNYITNALGRELLYLNTRNLGNFHLLEMLFRDYILYAFESGEELTPPSTVSMANTPDRDDTEDMLQYIIFDQG